tara:strand:- start:68487 stop:69461 length:975 start_codon:yes stop_codon:yes gene_type:complete
MSLNIAILGAANIAKNRFMPALDSVDSIRYIGVASNTPSKAEQFQIQFGGKVFSSYQDVIDSDEVDAVYIPLPPSMHFHWAKKALLSNKHVFLEKPSVIEAQHANELVEIARERNLVLIENYMFEFHKQIHLIKELLKSQEIGEVRLINSQFCFPFRGEQDFRYSKAMGGGALLDCGGYPIKLMSLLMDDGVKLQHAAINIDKRFDVDSNGLIVLSDSKGVLGQIYFGMNDAYKCCVEVIGTKGRIVSNRIFTAPSNVDTEIEVTVNNEVKQHLVRDNQFSNILKHFYHATQNTDSRVNMYSSLQKQANLISLIQRYQTTHENN